jgi:Na+:H+ antiporter, NhaA family
VRQGNALRALKKFHNLEAASGILLVLASAVALVAANSPLDHVYSALLNTKAEIRVSEFSIAKPLTLWINDGLMAVFFLLIGLEIKREFIEGELSSRRKRLLPAIAAAGGMLMPAGIYAILNAGSPGTLEGWAIPSATDVAFSLGVLSFLSGRVPASLGVLLTAIAIFDDLGAIIIIAVFYTPNLSIVSLSFAAIALIMLWMLNALGVRKIAPYVVVGAFLWVCVLKSGVHATLAGVALAASIPVSTDSHGRSPLKQMEEWLQDWVAFGVLPMFGFANAGVSFAGIGWKELLDPITLGIAIGLFVGKQIGVFSAILLSVRLGIARLPEGASWKQVYGMSILCGIGFTMSLFIGSLAWQHSDNDSLVRIGVLAGSIASAVAGYIVLRWATHSAAFKPNTER